MVPRMAVAGLLLLALATACFILDVIYVSIAFLQHDTRDARVEYMEDVTLDLFLARHSLFAASILVGDLFVVRNNAAVPRDIANKLHTADISPNCKIYRCWVVWDRNTWLVAFPLILAIVAAGKLVYQQSVGVTNLANAPGPQDLDIIYYMPSCTSPTKVFSPNNIH